MKWEYLIFNFIIFVPTFLIAYFQLFGFTFFKIKKGLVAISIAAAVFIIIDTFSTGNFWNFNPRFITGLHVYKLPIEEIFFFFSIPFACLLVWENIPQELNISKKNDNHLLSYIIFGITVLGLIFFLIHLLYTAVMMFLLAAVLLLEKLLGTGIIFTKKTQLFLAIVNILTIIFNWYLTARPIVIYNVSLKTNINLLTIPIEDFVFGSALLLLTVLLYEAQSAIKAS